MNENKPSQSPEQVNRELFLRIGDYVDRVKLVSLSNGIPPTEFIFELNLKSIIDIKPDYRPVEKDKWLLKVNLPKRIDMRPECEFLSKNGMMRPFHPHVKPAFPGGGGYWKDYRTFDPNEALLDLVLRICRSLQFDPAYLDIDIPRMDVGNEKAMNWFKKYFEQNPNNFPWDKNVILPVSYVTPRSALESSSQLPLQSVNSNDSIVQETSNIPAVASDVIQLSDNEKIHLFPRKKFSISLASEPYRPKREKKPDLLIEEALNSDVRGTALRDEVYVLSKAREDLFNHIEWTSKSSENIVEQGGLLVGEVFFDSTINAHIGIVERAIPAKSAQSSATHLSLSHAVWREMTEKIDNEMHGKQVIGWYHTHPNMLDVYMSEADLNTQHAMFPNDWQFAIILNPHREIWRAFIGYDGRECHGFFVKSQEENPLDTSISKSKPSAEEPQNIIEKINDIEAKGSNAGP